MNEFICNGKPVKIRGDHPHLLSALREELGIISPKDGCSPTGQCGCCTVLINGKARVACQISLAKVTGKNVLTLEGMDPIEVERIASAFAACGALQCGFCTPGIMVRTKSLIEQKGADLSREEASRHLGGHLCRCTGYIKILDAVEALARDEIPNLAAPGTIGTNGLKYEAYELAVGNRPYVDDMTPEGCLHGALRLTDHARAEVLSIDTSPALKLEGVKAVYSAADVPGELRVGLIHKDWPIFIPEGGRTSYLGDVLAIVVAETRQIARHATTLIEVKYEVLQPLTDPVRALTDSENAVWGLGDNVLSTSTYTRGDTEKAFASATHVLEETFQTQRVEHAFLEPESTLAIPVAAGQTLPLTNGDTAGEPAEFDRLMVYSGGQGIWDDRDDIARVLNVETKAIITELVSNGGAFGGKEDMSNQAQTALAAWLSQQPVKCTLSREESLILHPKRHPIRMQYRAGCDEDGLLTALRVRMIGDTGPYASVGMKVLERAAGHACGPYRIPNVDIEAVAVRTNNTVCGAFRGFGANQAQFAMEGLIDRLAETTGLDSWEIRNRNVIEPGDTWGPGQIMDQGALGARLCLDTIKPYYDAARETSPVGIALGLKNSGLGNGVKEVVKAVIHFRDDGIVEVRHCWTEMGQGVHTVALQVAVTELGIPADRIEVIVDSTRELSAGQTTGSRGTQMGAGAIAAACQKALADNCRTGIDYEGEYTVDWTNALSEGLVNPTIHSTFSYAAQLAILDPKSGEVDRMVAVHDVGKAVNPLLCEGQIEGSVHMGLGYALTEGFPCDESGRPMNTTLRSLNIIRPKDMPHVDVVLVEAPQPDAPYGIKGVGEIGLVPTAPAIAAALHAHDHEWRTELPMNNAKNRERKSAWT